MSCSDGALSVLHRVSCCGHFDDRTTRRVHDISRRQQQNKGFKGHCLAARAPRERLATRNLLLLDSDTMVRRERTCKRVLGSVFTVRGFSPCGLLRGALAAFHDS